MSAKGKFMRKVIKLYLIILLLSISFKNIGQISEKITKQISYNNVQVELVIEKPIQNEVDVLLLFHGTVIFDNKILSAANNTLEQFKKIIDRKDMLLISVAYPEENLLLGNNVQYCEAALLWVKEHAEKEMHIKVNKLFLAGHSQGGYIVTILNTKHATNGVIANAPGPLNLVFRCSLEENGTVPNSIGCNLLKTKYGLTKSNEAAYMSRSLLNYSKDYKADILFVQGLKDSPIQMYSWPIFKKVVTDCNSCKSVIFFEVPNGGHGALFQNNDAKKVFNDFINTRCK